MADLTDDPDIPSGDVTVEPLARALGERYLTYALSTITHRALPDARDGLKPVHRRILYAMRGLRLDPTGAFRKCAKIVGEVMGNYHPHGDQAIYDALARLAQDFNVRYPLVDGQGNFGNIDGDNPAAQRYTEARLTAAAAALMEGLAEDAVDFRDNYDGSEQEPVVLPAAFPNLLANGSSGIAVGMATNIPPHNIDELVGACLHLVKHPGATDEKLLDFVQGPDFPTGGVIVEPRAAIKEAYRTGRGGFRLRARWAVEDLGRGTWQIVVTEIPYQVQKGRLIERLAELINLKKIPILADVRDESAEDVRIVLEPRARTVDPAVLMETLFRSSDLETRFAMNMNVLIDGRTPQVASLREVLRAFLDHRRDVLLRRSRHRLERIDARLEILEGLLVAYLNLDRIIAIIRTEDEPKPVMMAEFALTDAQAEAILNTRLRALRRLEEMELRAERDALVAERAELAALLGSEELQWARIADELRDVRKAFGKDARGGARRTDFADAPGIEAAAPEAMIEREPVTVILSAMGWVRAMRGHLAPDAEIKFKDGDGPGFLLHAETTDRILMMASNGRMFTLAAVNLPGGRGMGEPVRLLVDLPNEAQPAALLVHRPGGRLLLASDAGDGFVLPEDEAVAQTRAGKQAMNLGEKARVRVCRRVAGDHVAAAGENRKLLVFPLADLPEMGRGKGVRLQKYKDGGLSDALAFTLADGLSWKDPAGRTRTVTAAELADWIGPRASAGRMAPRGFPQSNRFD
ncbi:DNA topoisomerase IV subunit A [Amaricoccus sp.]|uniref:DNA topoisomerase IV subunit A n=1 Tax=Amaricoccus sp. TaxID=1872485 RepID=UPI001B4EFB05|nr:DNA topoisomerase IV subunit A [Amaricoccus sp.]MBP7001328.1 DNA topoisomerase IV subunit A [Amaricoccus sp.]